MSREMEDVAAEIRGLSPTDKLKVAIGLLEHKRVGMALRIVRLAERDLTEIDAIVAVMGDKVLR